MEFVDRWYPHDTEQPRTTAARELDHALELLNVLHDALEVRRTEVELIDPPQSASARAVLRVLVTRSDEYLRTGEIHEAIPEAERPTRTRVWQILGSLDRLGLLLRRHASTRGHAAASFFSLAPKGRAFADRLLEPRALAVGFATPTLAETEPRAIEVADTPRVVTFYSPYDNEVRPLATALVGYRLAAQDSSRHILVVDLDLDAPAGVVGPVDRRFDTTRRYQCEGFLGLVRQAARTDPAARRDWLRGALSDPTYAFELPASGGLTYLPTGLHLPEMRNPAHSADARTVLTNELRRVVRPGQPSGLLGDLRAVLREQFDVVLINARSGNSELSYLATVVLADAMVLCVNHSRDQIQAAENALKNLLVRDGRGPSAAGRVALAFCDDAANRSPQWELVPQINRVQSPVMMSAEMALVAPDGCWTVEASAGYARYDHLAARVAGLVGMAPLSYGSPRATPLPRFARRSIHVVMDHRATPVELEQHLGYLAQVETPPEQAEITRLLPKQFTEQLQRTWSMKLAKG